MNYFQTFVCCCHKQAYYEGYLGTTISLAFIPVKYGEAGKYVKGKGDTKDIGEVKSFKKVRGVKVTAARKVHILDGDSKGGGHRYGTGKSGKTEFPQDWDDNKYLGKVSCGWNTCENRLR